MAAAVAQRPINLPAPIKRPPSTTDASTWDTPTAGSTSPAVQKKQASRPVQPPTPSTNAPKTPQLPKSGGLRRKDSQKPADIQTGKSGKSAVRGMATAALDPHLQRILRKPKPCGRWMAQWHTISDAQGESWLTLMAAITSSYILRKYRGEAPSLVVHLHPTNFRFEQQDGSYSYNSPMRVFLEHLRSRTVPHEMLEELRNANIRFYDGTYALGRRLE